MKNSNKYIKDGFTVIELLATIFILAIIVSISIFVAIKVMDSSKENSYKVTINNIEDISNGYVIENSYNLSWGLNKNNNSEYYCLTVGDLIDNGYIDNNVVNSKIDEDKNVSRDNYVYLERDSSSKSLNKNILITDKDSEYIELCNDIKYYQNKYLIKYDPNGGVGNMEDTECTYNESCTLRENIFTREGYTFLGWNTLKDTSEIEYSDKHEFAEYTNTENITLYAIWKINTVTIKYNVNGGTVTSLTKNNGATYNWTVNSNKTIKINGKVLTTVIDYNSSTSDNGLFNYNNTSYLNITKKIYHCNPSSYYRNGSALPNNEWICYSEECSGKVYDQFKIYQASDFCDLTNESCEIELFVNWYSKSLDLNGYLDNKSTNNIHNYGTADIWKNGVLIANDVGDYCDDINWELGDIYEIKDIKVKYGKEYKGVYKGSLKGKIGDNNSSVYLIINSK